MFDYFIEIFACIVDAFLAIWFISHFNKCKAFSNFISWLFIIVYSFFNISATFITDFSEYVSIINLIILVVFSLCNKQHSIIRRIVAPFVFEGTLILINSLLLYLVSTIVNLQIIEIITGDGISRIIYISLCKTLLWVFLKIILKFIGIDREFKLQDYYMLIVVPITIFFELAFFLKVSITYDLTSMYIYLILAFLFILLSNIGVYYLVYRISKNNELESEKELYRQMLNLENKRYQDMTESYEQIRQIRHDIKNQLLSVESKISNNDFEAAKDNLDSILAQVDSTGKIINCGNRIIDYIVNVKLSNIKNAKILVYGDASKTNIISDSDLSILLGNLLDNAIEAIKHVKNPEVELYFTVKNQHQSIICKNSINNSVLKNNPKLHTTKSNKDIHGYGLRSIKDIAERNQGYVEVFEENKKFCVQILIPLV